MSIVPSGKKRTMIAQSFSQDDFGGLGNFDIEPANFNNNDVGESLSDKENPYHAKIPSGQEEKEKESVREFIFNKLVDFGYPPRRLREFESEFASQKFYPDGNKDVTVTLPDRYYGTDKSLSESDLNGIVKEISDKFELQMVEGKREDKKITIEFVNRSSKTEDDKNEKQVEDTLDEVYGGGKNKKAQSIMEMIREARFNFIEKNIK
ncbi:MAG: hypothetical protein WDA06_10990 [Phenylobacterium sp.]